MDERTKNWHAAMERAVGRFQEERAQWPEGEAPAETPSDGLGDRSEPRDADGQPEFRDRATGTVDVTEVDEQVLQDLASKYTDVKCPIHGTPPRFELEGGAVREWFCCDALLRIMRELSARDAA